MLLQRVKTVGGWILVIFIIYAIIKSPTQAASIVHTSYDVLAQGVKAFGSFFNALLK